LSTSCPGRFTLGKRTGSHLTVDWVGLTAALDVCGKYHPHRYSILGPSSPWRIAISSVPSRPPIYRYALLIYCYTRNEKSFGDEKNVISNLIFYATFKCGKVLLEIFLFSDAIYLALQFTNPHIFTNPHPAEIILIVSTIKTTSTLT
jgi:hypothetical protein